ncbi:MAG TPA: hypothetical protein VME17_07235 [Bryobacteraceae bacterium]|nr:hypothetical protein [Bryobacteraceae bacterium]
MQSLVPLLIPAIYALLAIVLLLKFLRTRDIGFVWLGAAIIVWPLASGFLGRVLLDRTLHHLPALYPFSLVEQGRMALGEVVFVTGAVGQVIQLGLFLTAVLYLSRRNRRRSLQPAV